MNIGSSHTLAFSLALQTRSVRASLRDKAHNWFCTHGPSGQAFETKLTSGSAHIVRQGKPSRHGDRSDDLMEADCQEVLFLHGQSTVKVPNAPIMLV